MSGVMTLKRYPSQGGMTFGKIGARRMMWKNPYVTGGLIAWFSGEWNDGLGIHNANKVGWRDIISNTDAVIGRLGDQSFSDYSLDVSTGGQPNLVIPSTIGDMLNTTDYTIECAIIPASRGSFHGNRGNGKGTLYNIGIDNSGKLFFTAYYGFDLYGNTIELNTFHTVTVTSKTQGGNQTLLYNNGSVVSSKASVYNPKGGEWGIGGSLTDFGARGKYFQLRIYNRALTEDEVIRNHKSDLEYNS